MHGAAGFLIFLSCFEFCYYNLCYSGRIDEAGPWRPAMCEPRAKSRQDV